MAPRIIVKELYSLVTITILLAGFTLLFRTASGKPSAQPVEFDTNGLMFGQTDQRQYIDRTELISFPLGMTNITGSDDNLDEMAFKSDGRKQAMLEKRGDELNIDSNVTNANFSIIIHRAGNEKSRGPGPEYKVIKLDQ